MQVNGKIAEAVRMKAVEGKIACADAAGIADKLNVAICEVGANLDLIGMRITKCQLGLFGHALRKTSIPSAETVVPELEKAIRDKLIDNCLPCAACWDIAGQLGIARMNVSSTCDALDIKVKPCQLGAF
ncbi:MAG: hypothetical protein WC560_01050 [Syntrophales bacterium]